MKRFILNSALRRAPLQPLWEKLHSFSITAMNYWGGANFRDSGELRALDWAMSTVPGPLVVFDVGANRGEYASELARRLGPRASIFCFEPSKATYDELRERVAGLANVRTFNLGMSDKVETLTLYTTDASNALSSIYGDNPLTAFASREEVTLGTLATFCADEGIDRIDFLKLDIEGHEHKALVGARPLLERGAVRFVQFEVGECNIVSRTFFKDFYDLLSPGYLIYRVLPHALRRVGSYRTVDEIFACANFLAVRRDVQQPS